VSVRPPASSATVRLRPSARARRELAQAADAIRLGIVLAGAASLAGGDWSAALKVFLLLPPTVCARLLRVHPAFDLLFAMALGIEALVSTVGGYGAIGWWDTLAHVVLPLLSGPVLFQGLLRLGVGRLTDTASRGQVLSALLTFSAVLVLGALWELLEWVADSTLGTSYSSGYRDTITDLGADAVGGAGAAALVVWLRRRATAPVSAGT
jgi:hypothetical protein